MSSYIDAAHFFENQFQFPHNRLGFSHIQTNESCDDVNQVRPRLENGSFAKPGLTPQETSNYGELQGKKRCSKSRREGSGEETLYLSEVSAKSSLHMEFRMSVNLGETASQLRHFLRLCP